MALERTLVSRMFTEPAPLVHFMREQSPPPPDAARRGGPRTSGQVRPRARDYPGQQDSRHRTPCFPARRMETSPELEGHLQTPPLGLYLTGLEVLRRLRKENFVLFFLQRDLLSCLRNTARILLALYSPSPVFFFDCQPRFLDGIWTVFRDRVLVYAQGILKPTRLLIFTGFQSFDY